MLSLSCASVTVSLTSDLRNFMVMQNTMAGRKMGETGDSPFLLSRGFILMIGRD